MASRCRRSLAVVTLAAAAAAAAALPAGASAVSGSDWPTYERNAQHSSVAVNDPAINPGNASLLSARWTFTPPGPTRPGQPQSALLASPTVVGARVYIGSGTGVFYALDAATGNVVWQRMLDYGTSLNCPGRGITATATVVPDPVTHKLIVYAAGAHYLYALNAKTGVVLWKSPVGPSGGTTSGTYYNWSSPAVAAGRVFMGVSSACEAYHVRAGAVSFDQHTGSRLHTYYDMPAGSTGGSIWSSPATDGASVWLTTGDPAVSSPSVGDSYAAVRLDAATMIKRDRWRTSDPAILDTDFGSSPSLWPATIDGRSVPMVGACNKNGQFYAWRRYQLAAGPVWTRQVGDSAQSPLSFCTTTAAYDSAQQRLLIAGNTTTVAGQTAPGSLRAVDPSSGAYLWEQPLDCGPLGSPTVNGATGLVAVATYVCPAGRSPSVQLFDEATGTPLATIPETSPVFAQPVFAKGMLFVGSSGSKSSGGGSLTAYGPPLP
jgi:outer membrane protein assembly factor BamB